MFAKRLVSAAMLAALALAPGLVKAQTVTSGTYTTVIPASSAGTNGQLRYFHRLMNVGTSGVAWCSRTTATPAPNTAGSFPLAPFGNTSSIPSVEEFSSTPSGSSGPVPQVATVCTADSSAVLTKETLP